MGEQLVTALVVLLCLLICAVIVYASFYLAKHVVERQHRANVLEDSYKEAIDHIAALQIEVSGLNQQIEQMQYESQMNGERISRPRAFNPTDPFNMQSRQ